MAKTIKQLENGIRVKHLVRPNKYVLFWSNSHIMVDGRYIRHFNTEKDAVDYGNQLYHQYGILYTSLKPQTCT